MGVELVIHLISCIILNFRIPLKGRMIFSNVVVIVVFIITLLLVKIDSDNCEYRTVLLVSTINYYWNKERGYVFFEMYRHRSKVPRKFCSSNSHQIRWYFLVFTVYYLQLLSCFAGQAIFYSITLLSVVILSGKYMFV